MRALPPAFDFVFSCPSYYDLEQYSDDARDLSNAQTYAEFLRGYETAIAAALERLRCNRSACFVVGEVRDRTTGACLNFVGQTTAIFQRHGACLYNSAVLLTMMRLQHRAATRAQDLPARQADPLPPARPRLLQRRRQLRCARRTSATSASRVTQPE